MARTINNAIRVSILTKIQAPQNIPVVKSIRAIAILMSGSASLPFSFEPRTSQLSIIQTIKAEGMNESKESKNILCSPASILQSITSQIYSGGLSAYGIQLLVKAKTL